MSAWDLPSIGLAYIGAVLEENGYLVEVIDAHISQLSLKALGKKISDFGPKIIGITANGYTARYAVATAKYIHKKYPDKFIVMGGPYPTAQYEYLLRHEICDACVLGEGEYSFLELVKNIVHNHSLSKVKGIAYNDSEKVVVNPRRDYITDLDSLPYPAWHLFPPLNRYNKLRGVTKKPYLPIVTGRGCPFGCIWCQKDIHGQGYRKRSPWQVVDEMKYMIDKYRVKEFTIMDDTFTVNKNHAKTICKLMIKDKLNVFLNIYNGTRADHLDDEILSLLKAVGVTRLTIGVESGNQDVLDQTGKNLQLPDVLEAVHLVKKHGIIIDGFFILGLPFDTAETMDQTIQFAIKAGFDHAYFFTAIPYPGTRLFEMVQKKGRLLEDLSMGCDYHISEGHPLYEMDSIPSRLVQEKYRLALKRFYFRFSKIISLIFVYSRLFLQYRAFNEIWWLISQFLHLLGLGQK